MYHLLQRFLALAAAGGLLLAAASTASSSELSSSATTTNSLISQELSNKVSQRIADSFQEDATLSLEDRLRLLQESTAEDFDEFRELFRRATVHLPDFNTSTTILFADLIVRARDIKCFNIVLSDIQINYDMISNQRLNFSVDINDLDLFCTLKYEWAYSFFNGNGDAEIVLDDNFASTVLVFESEDFNSYPPTSSRIETCEADISITDMSFTGSFTDQVLNVFEGLIRGFVQDEVSSTVCAELDSLGTTLVQDMLASAAELLEPYLLPLPAIETNATIAEANMVVPDSVRLMDFQDEDGEEQTWFYQALKEVDNALGVWLIDPNTPREGGKDLGVNIFLRENILNSDRALEMKFEDLPFEMNNTIFQGHDLLTETVITMDTVRIYGLDTFNNFAPFINQGKYTLQNDLAWDFLSFELDVTIDMRPSTLNDSIIEETNDPMHITEKVTMGFGVDDINATLSVLLAIDSDAFGALKLGPLFFEENLLPCFWSSVFQSEVTVMEARIGNIREPAFEGFISKGIDNVLTQSVKAVFVMYESVVIRAMPNIFQLTVKDLLNDIFFTTYEGDCPEPEETPGNVDFRDLLLSPEDSLAMGGTGEAPYGTIAASLFGFLKTQIATVEKDGTVSANDMFIRGFTEDQSGVEGTLHLPGELFALKADDFDFAGFDVILQGFKLALSDVRLENIDILVPPLKILEPAKKKFALDNEVHFGPVPDRPLNVSAVLSLNFGDESPLSMNNDIALSMSSSAFEVFAQIVARLNAMSLLNFPIADLLNMGCWLATIPGPVLNELGLRADPDDPNGLKLSRFTNKFEDLYVGVECNNCTNSGLALLPTILELFKETDVTQVLADRMKFLVEDVFVSDTFQAFLDRMLSDASKECPHSPDYVGDGVEVESNYDDLPIPALSEVSIDTVQFVLATFVQVGFVVFTQLYHDTPVDPADALNPQKAFKIPENSNLVNFTDLEANLPSFLTAGIDQLLDWVSGTRIDPVTGQEDLAVNIFMRDLIGEDGVFQIDFNSIAFGPEDVQIELHSIRVEGLDSFKKFKIGVPAAPQTLLNEVEMETLSFQVDFGIRSNDAVQRVKFGFRFDDLSASVPLFAAIDADLLHNLQVGSLLQIENFLPCFFSAVYGFSFPHLLVNVGTIHKPTVEGLMDETSASLMALVDTLFERYSESMHASLPSVFNNAVRPALNSLFAWNIEQQGAGCTNPILDSLSAARKLMEVAGPPFVDFRDLLLPVAASKQLGGRGDSRYGDLIRSAWELVEDEILHVDDSGSSPINTDVIAPITKSMSGTEGDLFFEGDFLDQQMKLAFGPVPTRIAFRVSNLRIENIDSIGNPFSILDPVDGRPSLINNTATVGVGEPLRFGMEFFVKISNDGTMIQNEFDVSANLHSTTLILAALLKVSEYRFAAFPIGDIFELDCWLATLPPPALDAWGVRMEGADPSAAMEELKLSLKRMDLNVTCKSCTSPGLEELADLWSTPEASEDMTSAANDLLDYLADLLGGGLIQTELDRMVNDAAKRCPHSPEYKEGFSTSEYKSFKIETEEENISLAILVMIVAACLVACLAILVLVIRFIVRRRNRRWLKSLPNAQLILIKEQQEKEEKRESELNTMTQSMFTSSDVPLFVRWIIPVIILGNIAFFLSGHLSLGAEVKILVTIAGETLTIEQFYQFSMARSTVEIWQAGGKELATLILIFSGIWPYTKQLITFALWFLPPSWCSISRRGSILLWLDTLAKWSIVDIFTLVISVAAFRVSVKSPQFTFLPDDLYAFDLLVVPMWGLYANLIAQLISQVSSHFIIHYHRNIVFKADKVYRQRHHLHAASRMDLGLTESSELTEDSLSDDRYGAKEDRLHEHAYARPHRGESGKVITRGYVNGLVVFVALAFAALMIAGCILPSTGLEFLGVLGVAVESGQSWEQAVSKLSLFDLAKLLMDQARFSSEAKDFMGLGTLSALLVITVLIVPLAQTMVLLYQWFVPMNGRRRNRMSIANEILQAWQYAEVYVISVVVATWQLGPISTFMINSYCGSFQDTFNMLAYFGVLEDDDAQCFRVDASIESASYILVLAAILLALLNTFVMNAVKQYFRDRDEVISRAEMKERALALEEARHMAPPEEYGGNRDSGEVDGDVPEKEEEMAAEYWEGRKEAEEYIKPVPVLFTDKFRWLLRGATPTEELNGRPALPPPAFEITEKPMIESDASTSDDEQPTSSVRSGRNTSIDDVEISVDGSMNVDSAVDTPPLTNTAKVTMVSMTAGDFDEYHL